ncbi:uncharacterized protein EV420DRAFT_1266438 [Desarmillaria tabescens]|uniref:Virilizer N-terminal domain-containing protein n=1 Tax=Armillaria tabescens TaxID=1929756 RepID=A0AA39N9V6_ARMTA|nr:uncharacterized protein EV420DRAFT_1266438 [Desarmillaria tabescens]KAK0461707.1 hypothetical protein EV420DRAFT_1266438 [Desarmillaria tabescens]
MKLLHWCSISPEGPSGLAAVRFNKPVRVSFIRVYPSGAQPFVNCPDIVAETDPKAFYLDIFFNAHPLHPGESKEKQRAPNALVPTSIAYSGGQVDFTVDMGTEYSTRLMIVKGKFQVLSLAVYGEIVSEIPPAAETYEPAPLPLLSSAPLPKSVDPANAADPTQLAKALLMLVPDSPPLHLVIRLIFCLKPAYEDWDDPKFPYHNDTNLQTDSDFSLERAWKMIETPIRDDTSEELISSFSERVASLLGSKSVNQSYHIAKLFSISASQMPSLGLALCQQIDPTDVFDVSVVDDGTICHLLDAVANADIARHFSTEAFLNVLQDIQDNPISDRLSKLAASRLVDRIKGWGVLEDALSNSKANFETSMKMLNDVGNEEQSLGTWLETMTFHEDLVTKLSENSAPSTQLPPPRVPSTSIEHDEFIRFVRAFIGVGAVFAAWAWSDSTGAESCRERALAIILMWQGVDGYREIVNRLLLVRQFSRRLKWIAVNEDGEPPKKSYTLAEQIIIEMAKDPQALLHTDFAETVLDLVPPLSFISENQRLSLRKAALVATDGLPAAIEELTFSSDHPLSLRRLRTIRVSLAIVERELRTENEARDGEFNVLETIWDEHSVGLVPQLLSILTGVSGDLNEHFVITSSPAPMNQELVEQLFHTANDLLRLISLLSLSFPLTPRPLRCFSVTLADIFACSEAARTMYSSAYVPAQTARHTCIALICEVSKPDLLTETGKSASQIVLQALLEHGARSSRRDPLSHLAQVFTLILDYVLPQPQDGNDVWVSTVLPPLLPSIKDFLRLLDVQRKALMVRRIIALDDGVIGVAEWLLIEELKALLQTVTALRLAQDTPVTVARQCQVNMSLQLLVEMLESSSSWFVTTVSEVPDVCDALKACIMALLDGQFSSPFLTTLVRSLARCTELTDVMFPVLLGLVRTQHDTPEQWSLSLEILKSLPPAAIHAGPLRQELGQGMSALARSSGDMLSANVVNSLISMLEWMLLQEDKSFTILSGIKPDEFWSLHERVVEKCPTDKAEFLAGLPSQITFDEDEIIIPPSINLNANVELSIPEIHALFESTVVEEPPSTPKGTNVQDILGLVVSPPNALLHSPLATTLTKTYTNNDFRELRQVPSARQNTSRLPSTHGKFLLIDSNIASH